MTKKSIEKNIQNLKNRRDNIKNKISTSTLQNFNTLTDLYEDGKISRKETADKLINGILAKDEKGHKEYNKAVAKYENAEPLRNRPKVFSALRKAKKARKEQAVGVRLRKKLVQKT